MNRYLITTADQRTWKWDRPVLFLGEWCRLYDAKPLWSKLDAVVAEPYGIQPEEKARNHSYITALIPQLLGEVAEALNRFHQCDHSARYWNILIGHWLMRFVYTAFNRYFTLEQALRRYRVCGTTVFDSTSYCLATNDSRAFNWATNDDVWNHVLYSRILGYWGDIGIDLQTGALMGVHQFTWEETPARTLSAKTVILETANRISPYFLRDTDVFIINSYLPKSLEVRLQLSLGQFPQLWLSERSPRVAPDPCARQDFSIGASNLTGFERFVRLQLSEVLPTCYLEGYPQLVEKARSASWPRAPKFIFTSNSFDADEVFKAYAGDLVERHVPYFVGAHGSFAVSPYVEGDNTTPEALTSDKLFTWGWEDENPNNIPAFIFKTPNRKPQRCHANTGGLLLIELFVPQRKTHWDSYFEFGIYQEEQFRFVEALPDHIHELLTVRLHSAHKVSRWSEEQRWKDRSPRTRLDTGERHIRELTAKSRLVVHSYDSTGIPETLALNIPTMCFWYGGLDHLFPSARPYYELLRDAGIFADTPEQAARLIASRWDDLHGWWGSRMVQEARSAFCERICRTEARPVRTMKRLLNNAYKSTKAAHCQASLAV